MATAKVGERIGAILGASKETNTIEVIGYGEFAGNEIPPDDPSGKRGMISLVHGANVDNPKMVMDDGRVIWGCECWWVPEDQIKAKVDQYVKAGWILVNRTDYGKEPLDADARPEG